jgi:hypothetical protein
MPFDVFGYVLCGAHMADIAGADRIALALGEFAIGGDHAVRLRLRALDTLDLLSHVLGPLLRAQHDPPAPTPRGDTVEVRALMCTQDGGQRA